MGEIIDLTGQQFGRLRVIGLSPERTRWRQAQWICECECGAQTLPTGGDLRTGHTISCGCTHQGQNSTHGFGAVSKRTPEYYCWVNIHARCQNPNGQDFKNYGARGITVCERWNDFETFLADMGLRPSPKHSIERIDNSKGYSADNCEWATRKLQNRNKRTNVFIEYKGRRMIVEDWAKELRVPSRRIIARLRLGWDPVAALTLPLWTRYMPPSGGKKHVGK